MNLIEVLSLSANVHLGSFVLSLPAVYAVFGHRFLQPLVEKSNALIHRRRQAFASALTEFVADYIGRETHGRVANVILSPDLNAPAGIESAVSVRSESFREEIREFVQSDLQCIDQHARAVELGRKAQVRAAIIRTASGFWPVTAGITAVVSWCGAQGLVDVPMFLALAMLTFGSLPLAVVVFWLPLLATVSNQLDREEL